MAIKTFGVMGVDWEERVNFDRLRIERLARIKRLLKESELGALLCFDMNNIRYITHTTIGTWAIDKLTRFCLLPQDDEPINWDFGVAARHHQMYCPWLGDGRSRAGISTLRGAMPPGSRRPEDVARKIRIELEERGLQNEPLGVDVIEPPVLFALQEAGLKVADGQQLMQAARVIKTQDEITLLSTACAMVDAAYEQLYRFMRPGVRENECVGLVNQVLYDLGSEHVEGVNAISGERCSPHPHIFSDRMLRPGDLAFYDILHSYNGYRTCYYRTLAVGSASAAQIDAYKRCRYYLDAAINAIRPGVTTADVAKLWPKAQEFGVPNEEAAFALQFGHGVGLSIWEKPVFSRLVSFDGPEVIQENMVFALETYWPAADGWSAARIEEQLVVTRDGCEVITRFPAEELMVVGQKYYTAIGPLSGTRETQSHKNIDYAGVNYGGAGTPEGASRRPAADGRKAGGNHRKATARNKAKSRPR
jgi:Xaa-Pro aminopeptidase